MKSSAACSYDRAKNREISEPQLHSIKQFISMAQKNEIKCCSFDFFDTFVYRISPNPTSLFLEVGRRLKSANLLPEHLTEKDFLPLRQQAEILARKKIFCLRGTSECSLYDIYDAMSFLNGKTKEALNIEIETEHDFCFLNDEVIQAALYIKQLGKIVGIISDTYLSSDVLISILEYNGFPVSILNFVLTSSEYKIGKTEGGLFKILLDKFSLKGSNCVHIGDNFSSDYLGAQKSFVNSIHYVSSSQWQQTVFAREQAISNYPLVSASLNSFRVLASRMVDRVPDAYKPYFMIGAFIYGPCLTRFIEWCVDQIVREQISKVLVMMREAYTLLPAIKYVLDARNIKAKCYAFYVSRHAVNLASIQNITPDVLFQRTVKYRPTTPRQILTSLEIPFLKIKEIPQDLMDETINESERYTLCKLFATHPKYYHAIDSAIQKKRKAFLSYVQKYIRENERLAFVDIGFRGSTQSSIDKIFIQKNIKTKTIGLYLSTNSGAAHYATQGSDIRSYLGNLGAYDEQLRVFMSHPEILESCIISPIGTTLGYRYDEKQKKWRPILEKVKLDKTQKAIKKFTRKGIMTFLKLWIQFRLAREKKGHFESSKWLNEIDEQVFTIIRRLFSYPTYEEALWLGRVYHEDNNGTNTGGYVIDYESRKRIKERGIASLKEKFTYWPHGLIGLEKQEVIEQVFLGKCYFENP